MALLVFSPFRMGGVGPRAFDDYAALEEGAAREFIDSDMLTPAKKSDDFAQFNDAFQLCKLVRPDKTLFRLYDEKSSRHLLSARRENHLHFISSYELDKNAGDSRGCFCAVLRKHGGGKIPVSYRLHLCVGAHALDSNDARPIIEVWPSSTCRDGQHIRKLRIDMLPPTDDDVVMPHYTHDYCKLAHNSPTSVISHNKMIRLRNKTPERKNGTYSLKFARGRAKMSSSKNFLVYTDETLRRSSETMAEDAVFQLGKMGSKTFALDFCNPLSALQAFGVALAAFDSKLIGKSSHSS